MRSREGSFLDCTRRDAIADADAFTVKSLAFVPKPWSDSWPPGVTVAFSGNSPRIACVDFLEPTEISRSLMSIDLSHIAGAVDHSLARGRALALAYNDVDGYPSVSYRGSTHVLSATELGVWTRNTNDGLAKGVSANPDVSLALFDPETSPFMLSIRGKARVDASQNDRVYDAMIQGERDYDPDKGGVAIIIEVTSVRGYGAEGPIEQSA